MKVMWIILAVLAPMANAHAETLDQEGIYTGNLGRGVRGICRVEISNVDTGWFGGLKSADLSSTILDPTEVIALSCKSHIEMEFRCSGRANSGELVVLYPNSTRFEGEGAHVQGPRLVVYSENKTRVCQDLTLVN